MPIFKPQPNDYEVVADGANKIRVLKKAKYDSFDSSLLGLGNIKSDAKATDAIAAVFDLEGFTDFSKQIEPHLSVPLFLSQYLEWLFLQLKSEMTEKLLPSGSKLYSPLPFFVKFMGDGLLILWDASATGTIGRLNIVVSASEICDRYSDNFLPQIRKKVVSPPRRLRCGIARGTVYSVGDGNDFVGSCINVASRIQKLPGLSFAFNIRGFDLEEASDGDFYKDDIIVRKVAIRGIGDEELIAILKSEYNKLDDQLKSQFLDPDG